MPDGSEDEAGYEFCFGCLKEIRRRTLRECRADLSDNNCCYPHSVDWVPASEWKGRVIAEVLRLRERGAVLAKAVQARQAAEEWNREGDERPETDSESPKWDHAAHLEYANRGVRIYDEMNAAHKAAVPIAREWPRKDNACHPTAL